jgi:Zn-finger nucleic acid-binding protein
VSAEAFDAARDEWRRDVHPAPPRERRDLEERLRLALCPTCGLVMDRRDVGGAFGMTLDVCRGHGIWLDAGELEKLRELAQTPHGASFAVDLSATPRVRPIAFGDDRWWVEPRPSEPEEDLLVGLIATVASWLIPQ